MISPTDNVDSSISTEAAHSSSSLESRTESLTLETIGDTHENSLITVETARSSFEIQKPDKQLRSIIRDSKLTNREKLKAIKHFVKSNIRYYKRLTTSESLISIYFFKNIDYEHTLKHIDHATLYFKENGDEDCLAKVKLIETAIILAQTFQKTCVNTLNKADISKRSAEKFPYICKRILETKMGEKRKKTNASFFHAKLFKT